VPIQKNGVDTPYDRRLSPLYFLHPARLSAELNARFLASSAPKRRAECEENVNMPDNHPKVEDQIAWLKTLFGRPPVLSTEDPRAFEEIWAKIIEKLRPRDMIEQIFIWEGTVATWEMIRYNRHKTLMIQRKFRQREAQQRAQVLRSRPITDGHHAVADHPVARAPDENDHAQALESGINYFETLDTLQRRTFFRLNNALEQLEHHRAGLGLVLSRVAQEIIEGEFVEAADQPQPKQVAALAPEAEEESKPVATPPIDFDEAQQDPKPVAAPSIDFDEAQQDPKPVAAPSIACHELEQDPNSVAVPSIDGSPQSDPEASCASASEQPL
jgi:hypothetical protein